MTWVLAKGDEDARQYWTGKMRRGEPVTTLWRADAHKFHDAQAANEAASTHAALRNSDEWRPERLKARCERTR